MFEEEYCKLKGIDPPLANMPVKIPKFYAKVLYGQPFSLISDVFSIIYTCT